MKQNEKFVPMMLTLIVGVVLQVLFIIPDTKDTPGRAVIEFARAYFQIDGVAMKGRFCDGDKSMADSDAVGRYVYQKTIEARERGLGLFYLKDKLYEIRTHRISGDEKNAEIRLTAEVKPPLKSFFTKEGYRPLDEIVTVVNDNGRWKVCGHPFSMGL